MIRRRSVTPDDAGCQGMLAARLRKAGFETLALPFGNVHNFWARHGCETPLMVFAGHTDVVPPGPRQAWRSDPFQPEIRDGFLYGRGAADMKSSIAAMVIACERFVANHPRHRGSLALLITSDEEGPAVDGTVRVVEHLHASGEHIDWCLVGEPSSSETLGDIIKVGRRGSLSGRLRVRGVQGHVAYPHLAKNPIHASAPAIAELARTSWDEGNVHFPPTSFQVSNIRSGTGAENVIPGALEAEFNFRYSTAVTPALLKSRTRDVLGHHAVDYEIDWTETGAPFITERGELLDAVSRAVLAVSGTTPEYSTEGGTSDGRFIAPAGAQVVELGPVNATIHKVNECIAVDALAPLADIYERVMEHLLVDDEPRAGGGAPG
ncbi:MAG: succinyl-diaminopimelate desuccinylase [Myxococcota bacterium]